jgi:glycosyltransferase involved in cell wall biosynthesis
MQESRGTGLRVGLAPQGGPQWIAGVVYLQNLVRALSMLPEEERPVVFFLLRPGQRIGAYRDLGHLLPPSKGYTFRAAQSFRSKLMATVRNVRSAHWPMSLERLARATRMSVLFPAQRSLGEGFPCPWIGWIPDFQHKHLPDFFSESELRQRDAAAQRLVDEAPHIVVSSQQAYRDLVRWFPDAADRATAFPFATVAAPAWYDDSPERIVRERGLPRKFLIFPSQFWVHKNHRRLFEAIRLASEVAPDMALVCTGRMHDHRHPDHANELLAFLERAGLGDRVHCLGLLDRHTQIQLLRAAAAVVQPSLFEGWSSLLEEARAFGKKVYVSDIPVHREQDPPHARFFDPCSSDELAALIAEDWESLTPGPDRGREGSARSAQAARAIDFGRRFLDIVARTCHAC